MEFLKELRETSTSVNTRLKWDEILLGSYTDYGFRQLHHIPVKDGIRLSIQASFGHYCMPRKTLPLDLYTRMEMAILSEGGLFLNPYQALGVIELADRLNEYFEGMVYGNVPVELIEEVYQALKK